MSTLGVMTSEIKGSLVIEGTLKDAQIKSRIRSAIRLLQRKRYWFLRKQASVTLLVGASSVGVPTDFAMVDSIDLIYSGSRYCENRGFNLYEYERLKDTFFGTGSAESGKPAACAIVGSTIYTSHSTDIEATLTLDYFRKDITLPTQDNDTSVWFDEGYDVVRSLALYLFEKEEMGKVDADPSISLGYQTRLDEIHTSYERGSY